MHTGVNTYVAGSSLRGPRAIILNDSAHIQEEDVFYVNKRRKRKGFDPVEPLYETADVLAAVSLMKTIS